LVIDFRKLRRHMLASRYNRDYYQSQESGIGKDELFREA
jgi:hypothetical protein